LRRGPASRRGAGLPAAIPDARTAPAPVGSVLALAAVIATNDSATMTVLTNAFILTSFASPPTATAACGRGSLTSSSGRQCRRCMPSMLTGFLLRIGGVRGARAVGRLRCRRRTKKEPRGLLPGLSSRLARLGIRVAAARRSVPAGAGAVAAAAAEQHVEANLDHVFAFPHVGVEQDRRSDETGDRSAYDVVRARAEAVMVVFDEAGQPVG